MKKSIFTFFIKFLFLFNIFLFFNIFTMEKNFFHDHEDKPYNSKVTFNKDSNQNNNRNNNAEDAGDIIITICDQGSEDNFSESDYIPIDIMKYEILQFFCKKTLANMRLVNSETKKAIDDFILKRDFSRFIISKNSSYLINKLMVSDFLHDLKKIFENNKYDSIPVLYKENLSEKLIFLNKKNFKKECFELFNKHLSNTYLSLKNKKIFSFLFLRNVNFLSYCLIYIGMCYKFGLFVSGVLGPSLNFPVGIYFNDKIDNFETEFLLENEKKFEKEKEDLKRVFEVLE